MAYLCSFSQIYSLNIIIYHLDNIKLFLNKVILSWSSPNAKIPHCHCNCFLLEGVVLQTVEEPCLMKFQLISQKNKHMTKIQSQSNIT